MLIVNKIALRDFLEGSLGKKCHSACWGNSHAFVVGSEAGQCNNLPSKAWAPFSGSRPGPACSIQELSCPAWNHGRHHPTVHAGHENLNATCYMPGMLKSVFIRCAVPWASLCCLKPASLMFVTTVLQPTDLCHRQLRTGSDCRIPRASHYMCRCPLKNEAYNNSCYSYSVRCK